MPDNRKLAVVAIGGNSLIRDKDHQEICCQWNEVRETCTHIAEMVSRGWRIVVTHGNGPQVGSILMRNELAESEVYTTPLDIIVANTQGSIGYMIAQCLSNAFITRGIDQPIASVVTQVVVDRNDPGFENPTKGIGGFMTEQKARLFEKNGWPIAEDAGRGWRRVIASPKPRKIVELDIVDRLLQEDTLVIALGGGGIPVFENEDGSFEGTTAVIDKDSASSLLAKKIKADLFLISTAIPQVAINFNEPGQRWLANISVDEARKFQAEKHFKPGSMGPKVDAQIEYLEKHQQGKGLITDPRSIISALDGDGGTWIHA